jgi:hypothetical protein
MSWKDLLGIGGKAGDPAAPGNPPPAARPKGQAARAEENSEIYKEAIGLMQQFAVAGLEHLEKRSDYRLLKIGMADAVNEPAHLKISTGRGHIIEMRVPGKPEAKELQRVMREALGLPDEEGKNPLQRQEGSRKNARGESTYKLFLPIAEYRDGKFSGGEYAMKSGHRLKRLEPKEAVEILTKALRRMGITPDWQRYYEKMDRASAKEIGAAERELRDAMAKAEEKSGGKPGTAADESAKRRINITGDGTPGRQ